ncbi:MAG TPA: tripartite tricarboxylate transporter substrate binding protein [Thermodesulfobacteriota bacterium]|nr:tripartite tricarboxylate transporter substrate binding protein [Thermodesulfobacteriota bacterium]
MKGLRGLGVGVIALILVLGIAAESPAQKKYPTKPINVIIPFQPGDTDNNLRPFTEKMSQYLGQPLNFVYKPGASGAVGAGFVAAAEPDGYTLVGSQQSSLVLVPLTQKGLNYNYKNFAPIAGLAAGHTVLTVQPGARWKNIQELLAEAKREPGKISYVSGSGTIGITTLVAEAFFKEAGVKLNLIPAQGSGPAVTAILGGHTDVCSNQITPAYPHIQAGTLRPLIIFSDKRTKILPDTPTAVELGYKVNVPSLYGLLAPKGTPKEIVDILYQAAKKALDNQRATIENQLSKAGMQIGITTPEGFADFLKSQDDYWTPTIKGLDLKIN